MKFPFFSRKSDKEYFLGIFLKESQGILMIFLKVNGRLELIDREKFVYTNSWENITNDVDEALYKLEKNLELEIKKTIIFVYSHLIDEKIGDIKPVYLQKIKQLIKALDLQPMGYIECYEAVGFYQQKDDLSTLTAILVEIDKTQVGIFTYIGGKVDSKKIFGRTDDIIADLTEGFEEIKKKSILPSRIILYDSDNLEDTATKILSHRWGTDCFVQIPKVDILLEDEVVDSLMTIFGEQIKEKEPVKPEENKKPLDESFKYDSEDFGFMINADIGKKNIIPQESWQVKIIKTLTNFINKFKFGKIKLSTKMNFSGKVSIYIGILIIALGLFVNEYFFHKAQVILYLSTQNLEKNIVMDLDYRVASSSASFSETTNTSGKIDIGDKARGQVTIYNSNLSSSEILSKGSTISSPNSLSYVLENEVKISSASGDASSSQPATAKVSVIAQEIGDAYNLAANTKFSIDGKSKNLLAKNDLAFSGGSKKQIQTVSKNDQDNLKNKVLNKAKKEIPSVKRTSDEAVVSTLSEVDFSKINFSDEVGEESNKLTLQANVDIIQYLYSKKLFTDKILKILDPEVKSDYKLSSENITYTINKIVKKNNLLNIDVKVKGKAVIRVSNEEIKKSLLGKKESQIKDLLKSRYKIDGYNLDNYEPLPIFKSFLPFFLKNIILKKSSL